MKMEHERKWRVPTGNVRNEWERWSLLGDLYLPSRDDGPPLRLRQAYEVSDSDARWLAHLRDMTVAGTWLAGRGGEVVFKRGEGLSREEHVWPFPIHLRFNPQGVKLRAEGQTPQGLLSLDRYLLPRISDFEILELEGELDAVKAWSPPQEWQAVEVTGDKAYGNRALIGGPS